MDRPIINYSNMDDQYLDIGEFAGFSVKLSNYEGEIGIEWFHINENGSDIPLEGKNKYSLLVVPIKKQDFGAYYCKILYGPNLEYVFTSRNANIYPKTTKIGNEKRTKINNISNMITYNNQFQRDSRITIAENDQKSTSNGQQFETIKDKRNCIPSFPENNQICITSQPNDIVARIGEYVRFVCQVTGVIRCIEWEKICGYNYEQPLYIGNYSLELTLGPIQLNDFGCYRLKISNEHHEIYSRWAELKCSPINDLNTIIPHPVMQPFPVSYNQAYYHNNNNLPPIVIMNPKGGYYKTGTDVQLQSKFENASRYQWFRNDSPLAGCVEEQMNIHGVNRENEGLFQVTAYNINGQTSSVATMVTVFDSYEY